MSLTEQQRFKRKTLKQRGLGHFEVSDTTIDGRWSILVRTTHPRATEQGCRAVADVMAIKALEGHDFSPLRFKIKGVPYVLTYERIS